MTRLESHFLIFLLLVGVSITGCNVYEGLYEEGTSEDPEVLMEDARIAVQQDKPEEAVDHLRKALELTEDNSALQKRVQIKLASAVLLVHDIDVLSFSRIARNLTGDDQTSAVINTGKSQSQACLFPASHDRVSFDPTDGIDFEQLSSFISEEAINESLGLIALVFAAGGTTAFPCEDSAMDAAIADLQADGLSNDEIAEAMVAYSVAKTTLAYLDIVETGGDDADFVFVTPPSGSKYVSICFSETQSCEDNVNRAIEHVESLDCTTRLLQKRAELLDSSTAQELADLAREGYDNLNEGLSNAQCYAQ